MISAKVFSRKSRLKMCEFVFEIIIIAAYRGARKRVAARAFNDSRRNFFGEVGERFETIGTRLLKFGHRGEGEGKWKQKRKQKEERQRRGAGPLSFPCSLPQQHYRVLI